MSQSLPEQNVQPGTRANGWSWLLLSLLGLVLLVIIHRWLIPIPWAFRLCISAALIISGAIAIAKLLEPAISLRITPAYIMFLRPRGSWQVPWEDVIRFGVPRIRYGLETHDLPFIGIRLNSYDNMLDSLSPRLAVQLLTEQRQLLLLALRSERPDDANYHEYLAIADGYTSDHGILYRGLSATFATRMAHLRELLGYDLYISTNALDRSPEEFIQWLGELRDSRQSYTEPKANQQD